MTTSSWFSATVWESLEIELIFTQSKPWCWSDYVEMRVYIPWKQYFWLLMFIFGASDKWYPVISQATLSTSTQLPVTPGLSLLSSQRFLPIVMHICSTSMLKLVSLHCFKGPECWISDLPFFPNYWKKYNSVMEVNLLSVWRLIFHSGSGYLIKSNSSQTPSLFSLCPLSFAI